MKLCLFCSATIHTKEWICLRCEKRPLAIEGVVQLLPLSKSETEDIFDPAAFEALASIEDDSFWFKGCNRLIFWVVTKFFPGSRNYLEVVTCPHEVVQRL